MSENDGNKFADARETMAKELKSDPELLYGYEANVAMLLHDHFNRSDFTDVETRNRAASEVMHLVFRSPEPYPS